MLSISAVQQTRLALPLPRSLDVRTSVDAGRLGCASADRDPQEKNAREQRDDQYLQVSRAIRHDERTVHDRPRWAGVTVFRVYEFNRFSAEGLRISIRRAVGTAMTVEFSSCVKVREMVSIVRPR